MRRPLISVAAALLLAGAAGCSSSSADNAGDGRADRPAVAGSSSATADGVSRTGGSPSTDTDTDSDTDSGAPAPPATSGPASSVPPPGVLYGTDQLPTPAADRCRTDALTAEARSTGQGRASVVITNKGGASCTVRGFPSLLFLGESGHTELPVDWAGSPGDAEKLTLAPGASATAELTFTSLDECAPVTALDVVPPGESRPLRPAFTTAGGTRTEVRVCDTGVRVTAFSKT